MFLKNKRNIHQSMLLNSGEPFDSRKRERLSHAFLKRYTTWLKVVDHCVNVSFSQRLDAEDWN